jgi:hypothetical protein
MINAWSLLHSEMNGTMDEDYPIMSKDDDVTIFGGDSDDSITFTGSGLVGGADTVSFDGDWGAGQDHISFGTASFVGSDTLNIGTPIPGAASPDTIDFSGYAGTAYDDNKYYADGYDPYPTLGSIKPQPNLKYKSQKYGEDKGIADLKDYVSSTYQGHYTNESSDVQTLDLIHSVGDAESFCRSNALKYLSRYDKKGQAKRDILKAMHYCLLLYYFSGNTNDETPTRGYETF